TQRLGGEDRLDPEPGDLRSIEEQGSQAGEEAGPSRHPQRTQRSVAAYHEPEQHSPGHDQRPGVSEPAGQYARDRPRGGAPLLDEGLEKGLVWSLAGADAVDECTLERVTIGGNDPPGDHISAVAQATAERRDHRIARSTHFAGVDATPSCIEDPDRPRGNGDGLVEAKRDLCRTRLERRPIDWIGVHEG